MVEWFNARRAAACGAWAGCGPSDKWGAPWRSEDDGQGGGGGFGDDGGGGGFGVRRPLRFLAYKLQLDERQVAELAKVLNELKTERAQAEVDRRRSLTAFADAVGGEAFDEARAGEAGKLRVETATRLREAVIAALRRIHAVLDGDQRERLAYLIRTGTLVL
jgi:Spy/CpxP family protein refolding chaperone